MQAGDTSSAEIIRGIDNIPPWTVKDGVLQLTKSHHDHPGGI